MRWFPDPEPNNILQLLHHHQMCPFPLGQRWWLKNQEFAPSGIVKVLLWPAVGMEGYRWHHYSMHSTISLATTTPALHNSNTISSMNDYSGSSCCINRWIQPRWMIRWTETPAIMSILSMNLVVLTQWHRGSNQMVIIITNERGKNAKKIGIHATRTFRHYCSKHGSPYWQIYI